MAFGDQDVDTPTYVKITQYGNMFKKNSHIQQVPRQAAINSVLVWYLVTSSTFSNTGVFKG